MCHINKYIVRRLSIVFIKILKHRHITILGGPGTHERQSVKIYYAAC